MFFRISMDIHKLIHDNKNLKLQLQFKRCRTDFIRKISRENENLKLENENLKRNNELLRKKLSIQEAIIYVTGNKK